MKEKANSSNGFLGGIAKALGMYSKGWSFFAIFVFAIMLLYYSGQTSINGASTKKTTISNDFPDCKVTDTKNIKSASSIDQQTLTVVSSIDYQSEVVKPFGNVFTFPVIELKNFANTSDMDKCLKDSDEVLVVTINNITRIYPRKLLAVHVAINDEIAGTNIVASFSPAGNFYNVFKREYKNEILTIGNSGQFYKNNDLLFDQQSHTLWSQLTGKALVGKYTGAQFEAINFTTTSYAQAKINYPDALIASFDTGYRANYAYDESLDYANSQSIIMNSTNTSNRFDYKTMVLIVRIDKEFYVMPANFTSPYSTKINGKVLSIVQNNAGIQATLDGNYLQLYQSFWYVWFDFFPNSKVLEG